MSRQVVLLAGGLGTRLGSLRERAPKVMQPVAGRPLVDHLLDRAVAAGFDDVHLCLGYRADEVVSHLQRSAAPLTWSIESDVLLGTAGALKYAEMYLESEFYVWMGDTYLTGLPVLGGAWPLGPTGSVEASLFTVSKIREVKPNVRVVGDAVVDYCKSGGPLFSRTDAGFYRLRRTVLDRVSRDEPFGLEALWREIAHDGVLGHQVLEGTAHDIGTPGRLQTLERVLTSGGPE
jgi:NDP-sugar pyrophosphorylase family protein